MDIAGLGESAAEGLVDSGRVKHVGDLYSLTRSDLLALPLFGEAKASAILTGVEDSKNKELWRLLFGLGIEHVGSSVAKKLSSHFGSLDAILSANQESLSQVNDVGPSVCQSIFAFKQSDGGQKVLTAIRDAGVNTVSTKSSSGGIFTGKSLVITGTLSQPRDHFVAIIESQGGTASSSVTKKTSFLLAGDNAGSKLEKARSFSVPVLDEAAFASLVASAGSAPEADALPSITPNSTVTLPVPPAQAELF
jgi:DNA ligase (NAD+)